MFDDFFTTILNASWLQQIVTLLMQVLMGLVGILLLPLSLVIKLFIPDFDLALTKIPPMLDLAVTYTGWIFSAFGVPALLITLLVGYYTFLIMSKSSVWVFKLALKWYKAIK